ncbi:MAG: prolipoprotein diacylglyceryl transferase [Limisphaerales bacterium]
MHPLAIQIGPLSIHWYGILVAVGFLAGLWLADRRAPAHGLHAQVVGDVGIWLMVGAIVGARALHVISYWQEDFAHKPWWEMFAIHHGGLVFYGGLIGASLATVLYARVRAVPLWRLADVLAPSIPLGQFFGRLGCLMNGCCYGLPCALPWAIRFPEGRIRHETAVHPVQLYEAGFDLALYAFLAWQIRGRRFEGQTFALYLILYSIVRFGVEFFRGDYEVRYLGGWATPGQLASVVILAAGLSVWRFRRAPDSGPSETAPPA